MEATISNFRRGLHRQTTNQMILLVEGIDKEKAKSLIGKKVSWKSPKGNEIKGEIKATHGSKGAVRALFEKGMPGQAIGTKITIL
jgi:large subunit ribosomal protein L35Ae